MVLFSYACLQAARVPLPAVTLEFSCSNLPCRSDKLESGTLPNPVVACFYKVSIHRDNLFHSFFFSTLLCLFFQDEGKNKFAYLAKSDMVASTRDPEFDDLFDLQEVYDTTKIKMMVALVLAVLQVTSPISIFYLVCDRFMTLTSPPTKFKHVILLEKLW